MSPLGAVARRALEPGGRLGQIERRDDPDRLAASVSDHEVAHAVLGQKLGRASEILVVKDAHGLRPGDVRCGHLVEVPGGDRADQILVGDDRWLNGAVVDDDDRVHVIARHQAGDLGKRSVAAAGKDPIAGVVACQTVLEAGAD